MQYHYTPEIPIESTAFAVFGGRKNMVVTAGAERCTGWRTCVTTNCSVPPASNYTVAT